MSVPGEGAPDTHGTINVAVFTLVGRNVLGVVLQRRGAREAHLPYADLEPRVDFDDTAAHVAGRVASRTGGEQLLAPYAWQALTIGSSGRARFGYAAVAGRLTASSEDMVIVNPGALRDGSEKVRLIPEETAIVSAALRSLRAATNPRTWSYPEVGHNAGPIAARLLSTSDRFTLAELRQVFEAIHSVELDPRNFARGFGAALPGVVEIGAKTPTGGQPAWLYRMTPEQSAIPVKSLRPAVQDIVIP